MSATVAEEDISPYEILEVSIEATEQEIKTSYRKRSLKVHPDRNPNNPDAARKFHELNQAYELLLDPLRRLALDAKHRAKLARAARFKAYDSKRKNMVEELEERERAVKKARGEGGWEKERDRHREEARIKEEGRRLREERERREREKEAERVEEEKVEEDGDEPPPLDQFDTTVRLKYALKSHPDLTSKQTIATFLAPFGPVDVDSVVFSLKSRKKEKGKSGGLESPATHATALVPFKTIGDAYAAVCASSTRTNPSLSSKVDLKGMEITWVNNKEPLILAWLKKMGKLASPEATSRSTPTIRDNEGGTRGKAAFSFDSSERRDTSGGQPFSSFPDLASPPSPSASTPSFGSFAGSAAGLDYESLTMLRLRQAERERLEREIMERELREEEGG